MSKLDGRAYTHLCTHLRIYAGTVRSGWGGGESAEFERPTHRTIKRQRLDQLDEEMISYLATKSDGEKVEAVYTWIQCFIVRNIKSGLLNMPAPIATRVFQVMEQGMSEYQQVLLIMTGPCR